MLDLVMGKDLILINAIKNELIDRYKTDIWKETRFLKY